MEVFNKLKELSKEKFEDNFYLTLGLLFLTFYQLVKELILIVKKIFLFIHKKINDRLGKTK